MDKKFYYNSSEWKHTRKLVLEKQPYCVHCMTYGRKVLADEVHHCLKFYDQDEDLRMTLLTDEENCIPLCKECHKMIHSSKRKIMQPGFQQYVYNLKNWICKKYLVIGKFVKWTDK